LQIGLVYELKNKIMTQEQKDIILYGARYEMINACIYYDTGIIDVEKMAEAMQRYAEMYHRNELSKLSQHEVVGRSEQLPTDIEIGKMVSDLAKIADDEMER
jgi:hypothetical protein